MKRLALLLICIFCLPLSAQETELRAVDPNVLPNTFVNRYGTFAFNFPDGWGVSDDGYSFELYNDYHFPIETIDTGEYMLTVRRIEPLEHIEPIPHFEYLRGHVQGNYEIEEFFLAGRYAVLMSGINYEYDVPLASATIYISLENGQDTAFASGLGAEDDLESLVAILYDVAAGMRVIDPEVLDIDTSVLTETIEAHGLRLNYPEGYFVTLTDSLIMIDSADFADYETVPNEPEDPYQLERFNMTGIEGEHRIAFHWRSRDFFEQEDVYYYLRVLLEGLGVIDVEEVYQTTWNEGAIAWKEELGFYAHQTYFPNRFDLLYEINEEEILFVEAHHYGFESFYPVRLLMLNILTTVERIDSD